VNNPPLDVLLSYAFHPRLDHHTIKDRMPPGSLLWIDSGAFTAYTTGKPVTVSEYADHLERTRGAWDYAFTLDVIGDHAASMRQTDELIGRGYPVVPIFTYGTPLAEFRALCRDYGYVGCGGLVGLDPRRAARYLRTVTHIADEHGTAVHALGVAGRKTVIQSRVWSADSSAVSGAPVYGNVVIYSRSRRKIVIIRASDRDELYRHREDLNRYGFPTAAIMRAGKWTTEHRPAMFRASALSVADMWAEVRAQNPRPAPERLPRPDTWSTSAAATGPRVANAVSRVSYVDLEAITQDGPRVGLALQAKDVRPSYFPDMSGPRVASALMHKDSTPGGYPLAEPTTTGKVTP
jgi:hypothetical protein